MSGSGRRKQTKRISNRCMVTRRTYTAGRIAPAGKAPSAAAHSAAAASTMCSNTFGGGGAAFFPAFSAANNSKAFMAFRSPDVETASSTSVRRAAAWSGGATAASPATRKYTVVRPSVAWASAVPASCRLLLLSPLSPEAACSHHARLASQLCQTCQTSVFETQIKSEESLLMRQN